MRKIYSNIIKPALGTIISIVGFIVVLPLMLVLIIIILIESPGCAFFIQKRVGKNKKIFKLYKFRTMRSGAPANTPTHLMDDSSVFITKSGKFMRKFSLDELPQLINIIKQEMALIGPRPALWNQDDLIAERDKYNANEIRPGITGLAQVKGRDELPIEVKAKLDGEYKQKMSFFYDIKILYMTVAVVLKAKGIKEGK